MISVYLYTNEEAIENFGNTVYQLALCRVKNKEDACDIFQDVFLQLVKHRKSFSDESHLKAWLLRVTINKCTNFLKSNWYSKTVSLEEAPDEAFFIKTRELDEILDKLPDRQRTIIHLFYYEDLCVKDIAKTLSISASAVTSSLAKARKTLKIYLERDFNYD